MRLSNRRGVTTVENKYTNKIEIDDIFSNGTTKRFEVETSDANDEPDKIAYFVQGKFEILETKERGTFSGNLILYKENNASAYYSIQWGRLDMKYIVLTLNLDDKTEIIQGDTNSDKDDVVIGNVRVYINKYNR